MKVFLAIFALGVFLIAGCAPQQAAPAPAQPEKGAPTAATYVHPDFLVDGEWLVARLNDPKVRVVDLRAVDAYQAGHIPNSVSLPVARIYEYSGQGIPLSKEKIEPLLGDSGISNDIMVVAVDETGGTAAGRFFWTMEYYGHTKAKILNGGFKKWEKEGRELTRVAPKVEKAKFVVNVDPKTVVDMKQVQEKIKKPGVVILDARTPKEYTGEDVRAKRGGHVPGAINIDWVNALTSGDTSVFKSAEELKKLYEGAGVTKDKEIIVYCQTGTRSANTYFVLRHLLGYEKVYNYAGSWAEWGNNEATQIEK